MKQRIFEFVEPHFTGGDCTVRICEDAIIRYMHNRAKDRPKLRVATDKELLDDFIVTHWCTEIKKEGGS